MTAPSVEIAAAVAALETLLHNIQQQLAPIVNDAAQHAADMLAVVQDAIAAPASDAVMAATVNTPFDGTDGPIDWSDLYEILDGLDASIWAAQEPVSAAIGDAQSHVDARLADVMPSVADLFGGALTAFAELVSGLLGDLATTDDLWNTLYDKLRDGFSGDQDPLSEFITRAVSDLMKGAIAPLSVDGDPRPIEPPQSDHGSLSGPPTVEQISAQWDAYPSAYKAVIQSVIMAMNAFSFYGAMGSGWVSKYAQRSLIQETPTPLSPAELSSLIRRGEIDRSFGVEHAKRSGLSPELFDLYTKLSQSFITAENYVEMWRRTGDDSHLDMLHKLGVSDDDISRLRTLALAIPTPSDLVRFMVRDAFDPAAIAAGNLDFQFDQKIDQDWNRRVGVDDDTLRLYWRAHWALPSPTMFYTMFHRGFITETQMREALAVADFAPGWIENLVRINYLVPGRIDVRRMYEAGIITDDADLIRRHTDMGYSPEDAATLAGFVKALKAQQDEADATRLRGPLVAAVIKAYADGAEDYDTALDHLVVLGLTRDTAVYRLQEADLFRERDRADRVKHAIGREYTRGFISKGDAQERLNEFGFEQNEADGLFASWDLDRELSDMSAEAHHQRDLTRAEVIEAYTDHIIDAADAAAHLTQMGYDGQEAATIISLADYRATRADQKAIQAALKAQYTRRDIDDSSVRQTLESFGYSQARIVALITEWTVERDAARPRIPTATLEKLLMQGIVPIEPLVAELQRRGFTDQDTHWLSTLWGTDVAITADKLAEQRRQFEVREARLNRGQQAQKERFDAQQAQQQALQTQRLAAATATTAASQAFAVERDARAAATRLQQSHDAQAAVAQRLDQSIAAANARQDKALAQRDAAVASREALTLRAQDAADARQARNIQAQADRLQTTIDARSLAAASAAEERDRLQAASAATQEHLANVRAQIQAARDVQSAASQIAKEQRAESAKVRAENRSQARKDIGTAQAAAARAQLDALQRQRDAAVADLTAKLAAIEATAASVRQQQALAMQQEAQRSLTANIPIGSFTDSSI